MKIDMNFDFENIFPLILDDYLYYCNSDSQIYFSKGKYIFIIFKKDKIVGNKIIFEDYNFAIGNAIKLSSNNFSKNDTELLCIIEVLEETFLTNILKVIGYDDYNLRVRYQYKGKYKEFGFNCNNDEKILFIGKIKPE